MIADPSKDTIEIPIERVQAVVDFIEHTLRDKWEEILRRIPYDRDAYDPAVQMRCVNPEMYDFAQEMHELLNP